MITFQEACESVGYDSSIDCSQYTYKYYAYKNGECRQFTTEFDAKQFSTIIEKVCTNDHEVDNFFKSQKEKELKAINLFVDHLKSSYPDLSSNMFYILYSKAYELAHSSGYDEVANTFHDLHDFYLKIKEELKESVSISNTLVVIDTQDLPFSWDEVELNYEWAACDSDGRWYAYEERPFLSTDEETGIWHQIANSKFVFVCDTSDINHRNPYWKHTLQQRPKYDLNQSYDNSGGR